MTNEYPPFADGGPKLGAQLSQSEKKKSGHIFADCALYGLPVAKGKAKPCDECVARYRITADEARAHQAVADAAWRGEPKLAAAPRISDYPGRSIPEIDVYEAVIDVPKPAPRDHRPNKFGGKCVHCTQWVEAGAGALGKNALGAWCVAHIDACPAPKSQASPTLAVDLAAARELPLPSEQAT